jgi:hypothetical protein
MYIELSNLIKGLRHLKSSNFRYSIYLINIVKEFIATLESIEENRGVDFKCGKWSYFSLSLEDSALVIPILWNVWISKNPSPYGVRGQWYFEVDVQGKSLVLTIKDNGYERDKESLYKTVIQGLLKGIGHVEYIREGSINITSIVFNKFNQ